MPENKHALNDLLRQLPKVDAVLEHPICRALLDRYRKSAVCNTVRRELAVAREELVAGQTRTVPGVPEVATAVKRELESLAKPLLKPVVNASGIVLHTNLGRALLTEHAAQAVERIARRYCNLELDLHSGRRTRRDVTLEPLLKTLTDCAAATVVNNNSAAVFLMLNALAAGGEVITSRGELVEIGGSYRVPDVVAASGCKLVEVGTTNRTRVGDYERAITPETALLLKTHTSNYRITGFTAEASVPELAQLAHRRGIPLVVDLGSGYLAPEDGARLPELDIQALLDAGADLVSFSGDKLLGGPQAGIVLGRASLIHKLRASPLWRVVRIDKFTVAALAATLVEHLRLPEEEDAVEITRRNQVGTTPEDLRELAEGLAQCLSHAQPKWDFNVAEDRGYYGGGSLPEEHIPAPIVRINCPHLSGTELDEHLRRGNPPVVGYLRSGEYALNVLALVPGDVELIVGRIKEL